VSLTLHPIDPVAHRQELSAVLGRNLTDLDHARRFEWLYLANPAGPARAWFLREGAGAAVAVASLFPRWMWLHGQPRLCGQVGDFAVDAGYRSLGPAVLLQRATFQPVDAQELTFCYDCPPHDRGMATFQRLRLTPNCRMVRYARLLKVDRLVRRYVRPPLAAAPLSAAGNTVLRLVGRRGRRPAGTEVSVLTGRFDDEVSRLDEALGSGHAIRSRRHADDLNWRYRDDPLHEYLVLTARRGGALVAFAVLIQQRDDAYLVDLFGRLDDGVALELVAAAVDRLRRTSVQTLHALVAERSPLTSVLEAGGFRYRSPGASIVAYARDGSDVKSTLTTADWSLTESDIRA
jgi:hypothetical protein